MTRGKGQWKGRLGTHLNGIQMRSSHLGYDCYLTGSMNGAEGKCRMKIRVGRLPEHITEDVRAILPPEMWWPQRNHSGPHGCIDAVMTRDYKSLEMWKRQWPDHEFGFESYLVWCKRAAANDIPAPPTGILDKTPTFVRGNTPQSTFSTARFPVGRERSHTRIRRNDYDGYFVEIHVVKFYDLSSALRVDLRAAVFENDHVLLGRAYVDLIDGTFQIIEHHPGRCAALSLPKDTLFRVLGVRPPRDGATKHIHTPRRVDAPEDALTPRQRTMQVSLRAAQLPPVDPEEFERFPAPVGS